MVRLDEIIAGEAAGQEREDINHVGGMAGVDEESDGEDGNMVRVDGERMRGTRMWDENVVREVPGRDKDTGQDIGNINGGSADVGGDRNYECQDDVKPDEDDDIGMADVGGDGNGEQQDMGAGEVAQRGEDIANSEVEVDEKMAEVGHGWDDEVDWDMAWDVVAGSGPGLRQIGRMLITAEPRWVGCG